MANVFGHSDQLTIKDVGLMLCDEGIDFLGGFAVVEITALHWKSFQKSPDESEKDSQLGESDEVDGAAIGLQCLKSLLLIHLFVVVEGTKHNLVLFGELLDLVVSPELVAFLKRIRYTGKEYKDLHGQTKVIFDEGLICW